jgi:hypothetical protein
VRPVKAYLQRHAYDPDALQFEEWSPVAAVNTGVYLVRVRYRAKNVFGAYILKDQIFTLSKTGEILDIQD